jgi:hypothetical protein
MADIALRPRTATELVDAAFQVYRRDPLQFIVALALIYIPWMLIASLTGITTSARPGLIPDSTLVTISLTGTVLVYTLSAGVTTILASDVYFNRPADVAKAFIQVGRHLVALLVTNVIGAIMIFVGFTLFFVPGFYMFARLFAITQVVMLENGGVGAAFSRTSFLSQGHKRHIINAMALVFLLNVAVSLGVSFMAEIIPSLVVRLVISTIVSVLVYPIVGITSTLLYYDVRIRREGFDIEYLAAASGPPTEPAAT